MLVAVVFEGLTTILSGLKESPFSSPFPWLVLFSFRGDGEGDDEGDDSEFPSENGLIGAWRLSAAMETVVSGVSISMAGFFSSQRTVWVVS